MAAADPIAASPVYPAGSRVNERGHLEVAGCDVVELAAEFGTPAYIYAEDDIRARAREFTARAFAERTDDFEVLFASKALPCTAAYALLREEGLSVDVASGGELHMALAAGFDPERIHMHGNNKTEAELRYAIEAGVGHVIVDSFDEIERLDAPARPPPAGAAPDHARDQGLDPLLHPDRAGGLEVRLRARRRPGRAGGRGGPRPQATSSWSGCTPTSARRSSSSSPTRRRSRCSPTSPARSTCSPSCSTSAAASGSPTSTRTSRPRSRTTSTSRSAASSSVFDPVPRILIEPGGRWSATPGVTAYRIGTVKEIPGVRTYVAVDGGMSDNLRPMLYGAALPGRDRRPRRRGARTRPRRSPACTASRATC